MHKRNKSYIILGILVVIILATKISSFGFLNTSSSIGVIEISMPIMESKTIIEDINYLVKEKEVNALIVRLNTPGGGVAASQEIFEKVKSVRNQFKIPVVASIGGVAASGGYYIAIGADSIIANSGSITGSIGVVMSYPVAKDLIDKIGLQYETIKSGALKDAGSTFRETTKEDTEYFQAVVDNMYDQFIQTVAVERNLDIDYVKRLATGEIFTGEMAVQNKLIDGIGTFEDAIEMIKKMANIYDVPKLIYPEEPDSGLLKYFLGDSELSTSFSNFLLYPIPQFRLYYAGK